MYLLALVVGICCAVPLVAGGALAAALATVLTVVGWPGSAVAVAAIATAAIVWLAQRDRRASTPSGREIMRSD